MIAPSHIATCADSARPDGQFSEERIKFKVDPIWSQVADVSYILDPGILCDLLDEQLSLSRLSAAVGSTVDNPQDPYCLVFMQVKTSLMSLKVKPMLKSRKDCLPIYCLRFGGLILKLQKRTIKKTTQLNRQDTNSNLSRNFGTNDWMLRYKWIKPFLFTYSFFVTNKANIRRSYSCMQIFVSTKGYVMLLQ